MSLTIPNLSHLVWDNVWDRLTPIARLPAHDYYCPRDSHTGMIGINGVTSPEELLAKMVEALNEDRPDAVPDLARDLARQADDDFPALHAALNLLGYHNYLSLINEVMHIAWPQVQEAATYSRPALNAYASRAADHVIYAYLTDLPAGEEPDPRSPELHERLERYFPIDPQRLETYLLLLHGRSGRQWTLRDFQPPEMRNISGLMIEFLGYSYRHESIPYARGHLLRDQLPRYILDREAGNLYPKEDVAALLRGGRRPRTGPREPKHPLCPDAETLKTYLRQLVQTVRPQPYAAAALVELAPAWLRFLVARGLVAPAQQRQTLDDLQELEESPVIGDVPAHET